MSAEIESKPIGSSGIIEKKSSEIKLQGKVNLGEGRMRLDLETQAFNLPETMDILGEHWVRKSEFHITVISSNNEIARQLKGLNPEALSNNASERQAKQVVSTTAEGKSFKVKLGDEIRVVQVDDKKTIVRMVEVEGIEEFFQELETKLGFSIERPPTHTTLYTLENGKSIGIHNQDELRKITQDLTHADSQKLKKALGLIEITGSAYGWGKIARTISEELFLDTLEKDEGNFVFVDLCSALPIFPQIIRERHLDRCYTQAKKIAGDIASTIQQSPLDKIQEAFGGKFSPDENHPEIIRILRKALAPKGASIRKVITSVIQDLLYSTPSLNGTAVEKETQLAELFLATLESSDVTYENIFELKEKVGRGGWEIKMPRHTGKTTRDELINILGEQDGAIFIKDLAFFLAKKSLPHIRGFKVLSVDIADPSVLREEAKNSFPANFRETEFYRRIIQLENHVQADISQLPFQKESVSFFTCFEGWPFYKIGDEINDIKFAQTIFESLKPGGKALFFPWQVNNYTDEDERRLAKIKAYWKSLGLILTSREHSRSQLIEEMGDRELMLTDHSPVFAQPNDVFNVLVLEKPKEIH